MPRYNRNSATKVDLHWSQKAGAYSLHFHNMYHFNESRVFMNTIKTLPWGEYEYDDTTKTWFFHEKILGQIQALFSAIESTNIFDVDFIPKPDNQAFQTTFVSIDTYLDKFKQYSGEDIRGMDYNAAKKLYRRTCMKMHPDRGGDTALMSDMNEAWLHIEETHFKIKKEVQYETV